MSYVVSKHKIFSILAALTGVLTMTVLGVSVMTSQETYVVPVLEKDGSISAAKTSGGSLFASAIFNVFNSTKQVLLFSETEVGELRDVPDISLFYCPPGTNTPAYSVFGVDTFYSSSPSRKVWGWGPYGNDEGNRIKNGESPSDVFIQSLFLGNEAAQEQGHFPFIGTNTHFTEGQYVATGQTPNGEVIYMDCIDSDGDGLNDTYEGIIGTDPLDADTDDDGLPDGQELTGQNIDFDNNGLFQLQVTDPLNVDTDGDGIQDGTELGLTAGIPDTDLTVFIPDADPTTTTDPTVMDTDGGGVPDGMEDGNKNGRIDAPCDSDPTNANDDTVQCGDGIVQSCGQDYIAGNADDEACDDGPLNGQPNQCNVSCTGQTSSACGNAIVEIGEGCDDGDVDNGDGCSSSCALEQGDQWACLGTNLGETTICSVAVPGLGGVAPPV